MRGAPGSIALQVMNPINGAVVDAKGDIMVQGRTAPFARVNVRVDAVPPIVGQMLGVAQIVFDETVQADREGYFDVAVRPRPKALTRKTKAPCPQSLRTSPCRV